MLKKVKSAFGYTAANKLISKEAEYKLYEKVSQDISEGERDEGVWTLAFAKSEGNKQKAEAKYIELMVERYKDWIEAGKEVSEILEDSYQDSELNKETHSVKEENKENSENSGITKGTVIAFIVIFIISIFTLVPFFA